ncbi:MAG: hypothetical protein GY699_02770 [Desulfobacteraceae bacterium]|nr:hypothetical protein [Desulfobacteraceae bacterium]
MIPKRLMNALLLFIAVIVVAVFQLIAAKYAISSTGEMNADRAVEIAKRSRDRIENSGSLLKQSSGKMFSEFAGRTGELQKLLDTRQRLEKAGMLSNDDPLGKSRRANINAKIILEVGKLKEVCDLNLDTLLMSLDAFDRAIADSVVDTQATRSINSNYELIIRNYKQKEQERFVGAAAKAEELLEQIRTTQDSITKKRLIGKYNRIKKRLNQIKQRRVLYESRLKVTAMNQKISGMIRQKIRQQGSDVPSKFRNVMSGLYTSFAKVVPVAETGGTGFADSLENFGFANIAELSNTLDIVEASTQKLNIVLDQMVDDVIGGLDEIQIIDDASVKSGSISFEKEMEYISKERAAWTQG